MGEFFHGWRRKVGVVALVLACVVACAWCRSCLFLESIRIPRGDTYTDFLVSFDGRLNWARIHNLRPASQTLPLSWSSKRLPGNEGIWISTRTLNQTWNYRGLGVWEHQVHHSTRRVLVIPYWSCHSALPPLRLPDSLEAAKAKGRI